MEALRVRCRRLAFGFASLHKAACLVAVAFASALLAAPPVAAYSPCVLGQLLPRLEAVVVVGGPMAASVL